MMNKNVDLDWSGTEESFKAWMTVRDADLGSKRTKVQNQQ